MDGLPYLAVWRPVFMSLVWVRVHLQEIVDLDTEGRRAKVRAEGVRVRVRVEAELTAGRCAGWTPACGGSRSDPSSSL